MATTLVQFWQLERDIHEAAQTAAQNDLAIAQQALVSAKATLDDRVAALNKLTSDIAANRVRLGTLSVPSEVTALNATIRDQIIKHRAVQGAILDDQEIVANAQADAKAAAATLKRATARVAESDAGSIGAKDANKQRQLLLSQLGAPPFDTIQADAVAAAASAAALDAKAELDDNIPAELQTIAGKRHATRTARAAQLRQAVTDAENALGTALSATSGLAGVVADKAVDFRLADQALRDYATSAKQRYDRAIGVIADLQARKKGTKEPHLLTKQEKLDVAATGPRTTAETKAEPIDKSRTELYAARQTLNAEIISVIASGDVDKLSDPATLKPKRDAIGAKVAALKTAQDGLVTSGDKTVLDEWESVVQDPAWRALIEYLDATATLAELAAIAPATLATTLANAETAYAGALSDAAVAQRQADALTDAIALRNERVDASTAALPARLLSAVRGDSY